MILERGWQEDRRLDRRRHGENSPNALHGREAKGEPPCDRTSRRALAMVFAAGALALLAVVVALFWPSAPPLTARARVDAGGREGVELACKSCPDGTTVSIDGVTASMTGGLALLGLPTPLSVGQNRLTVTVDRPGNGRDETLAVSVNVAFRIRPDLATLQGEKPAFQIVAEVARGTSVSIDGHNLTLSGGRAVETIDVTDACTGLASEVKTLSRQVPYVVTPDAGPPEHGVVSVSLGVVPLYLEAPVVVAAPVGAGASSVPPHVITDGPNFVIAGRTMKGAEVVAAGRAIPVRADGSFAQVMNVSSVGATQIEVRARVAGLAPRIAIVRVRRVESLDKAARDFAATESPIGYADLAGSGALAVGKAVSLSGEVSDVKKQGYQTVMLIDVSPASGCSAGRNCTVRLVQAGDSTAKRGDTLRVFGYVGRPFSVPGRADIPEIDIDFALKGTDSTSKDRR